MPTVPSNIEELLDLVVQEIIDNTSGLIEEHTLRYVLSQIVKVLDTKISLISPELTTEQLAMWKKLADFKASDFIGAVTTSTAFPSAKSWGFAGPGTYANANGLVVPANNIGVISFDGSVYSLIALPLPQATKSIPQFADLQFPVTNPSVGDKVQCVYNNLIVQLKNGKTATIANVPTGKDDDEYWMYLGFNPVGFWYKRNIIKGGSIETPMTNFWGFDVYVYFLGYVGNVIAISFDCIAESSTDLLVYPYQNRGISIKDSQNFAVTTSWNRYSYVTEIKNFGLSNLGTTIGSIGFFNNSIKFMIKNLKIEFGLEATPF